VFHTVGLHRVTRQYAGYQNQTTTAAAG